VTTGRPEVVLFDVGNTLLFPNWQRILAPLAERNIVPQPEQLREAERQTKREFDQLAKGGCVDRNFWRMFYTRLLQTLRVADNELIVKLTAATRTSANWDRVLPGTREALDRIGSSFRIGVISNADGKIDQVLKICGICDCFLSITDSGIAGYEKPHPEIFAAAVRSMGIAPDKALYVGDVYSVDYVGATGARMQAVLFDVAGAYSDTGLPRVASMAELEQRLGVQ
jgi:FMN phosphatase YigB (HAD superfamily)